MMNVASAQTPTASIAGKGCPIEIDSVNPNATMYDHPGKYLEINYRNVSGKDIRAIKFGALFFNAVDEPTDSYTHYLTSETLAWNDKRAAQGKPQYQATSRWSQYFDTAEVADAYVMKVKFADGTFWADDGSFACNAGIPVLHIAKGGGLKAHESAIKELERKTKKGTTE
jgi:hypothetical protein